MRQHLTTSKLFKAAGILFMAASSVYADQAPPATGESPVASPLLDNAPTATAGAPATQPAATAEPLDVPVREGNPVSPTDVSVSNDTGTVEIHVNDASLVEVLKMISMQSQKNIVASKEVHGTITANLYDVTMAEALDAILASNGYAYKEKGNFIYVYTKKELIEMERAERRQKTEAFRLFYTPAANVAPLIKPALSADPPGQYSFTTAALSGIESGAKDVGGLSHATEDMIVVTDFPENLEAVRNIIREVDQRPQQILIEATILRAALTEDNALGVDFNVLAGANFNNILTNTGGQITGANTQGTSAFPADSRSVGGVGTGNNFTNSVNGGLKLGFVSDNVSIFLAALEGVTDTSVLANPKVLALNKQRGEVIVGRKDGYITTTVSQTTSTQSVEFLETGTRLVFRPYVGNDGFIRMEIHPEDSTGGLNNANLPFKVTTEVTSNIMVKDGHTIVIGGLFRESTQAQRSQVPGLGNLPGAGYLFRNQKDNVTREEIIVLLTPHVIRDQEGYSKDSLEHLKDIDRIRVGIRSGLMPFGRNRLAECSYETAVAEMNKPNPDRSRALWHLNCATNLNPKYLEAIKLKEQITGQQLTASDHSSIRDFVLRRTAMDIVVPHTPEWIDVSPKPREDPTTRPATLTRPVTASGPTTAPSVAMAEPTTKPSSSMFPNPLSALFTPAEDMPEEPAAPVVAVAPTTAPSPVAAVEEDMDEDAETIIPVTPAAPVAAAPATTQPSTVVDVSEPEN